MRPARRCITFPRERLRPTFGLRRDAGGDAPRPGWSRYGGRRADPPALRRALHYRDRACRFPGCARRFGEGHHMRTSMPGWLGERLDVGYAIGVLHPLAVSNP